MRFNTLVLLIALSINSAFAQYPQDYFRSPLDIPLVLSGTFGELRSNHFHSGIDIKTEGVEGKNIYAVADGYVSRIKISPWGYGNAIYVTHPNGYTTVYGHLKSFRKDIEEFISTKQYDKKNFEVDLYLDKNTIKLTKGEVFCYSGNSGGSGGPHLHFEIRKTSNSKPINPLLFGIDIPDHQAPVVAGIYFYKFNPEHIEREHLERKHLNVTRINSRLYKLGDLKSFGTVGFAIHTYDKLDGANNKNGPFTIDFYVDTVLQHSFKAEQIDFSKNRYLNAHIDYNLSKSNGPKVNRSYVLAGSKLDMYPFIGNSILTLQKDVKHDLKWEIVDVAGNKTVLIGTITGIEGEVTLKEEGNFMPFDQDNYFKTDWVQVNIPKGALYQSIDFKYEEAAPCYNGIGQSFHLGSKTQPLQKRSKFKIKVKGAEGLDKQKLIVVNLDKNCRAVSLGGSYSNGWIEFKTRELGQFGIMIDTTAPVIKRLSSRTTFTGEQNISFKATDDLSGIESYNGYIDGKWVLIKYDPKKAKFYYTCKTPLTIGKHSFKIIIADGRKNSNTFSFDFEYH